jgi:CBS domain-containing protein/anti-sigma regulatory factor (Ser/Thr protein kinase)
MTSNVLNQTLHATRTQELMYELRVQEAMSTELITVEPETSMDEVLRILKEKRLSGTPVTKEGDLVGIVSIENLIRWLLAGNGKQLVKQWMTTDLATLFADEPLVHAVQKFGRYRYGRFPVVDRKTGSLVGILSKGDILRSIVRRLEIDLHRQEVRRYTPRDWFAELVSDRTTLAMHYRIKGKNFDQAGEASSQLKRNLHALGISPDAVRRICIASYEAEMNLVIFTEGGELIACVEPRKVTIKAVDIGPGIPDIELAMQPGYSTAPDWVRELGFGAGMGLPNIKNCSDELKLESKVGVGTNLEFTVHT